MVDCPICAKAVKDARINEHIDSSCQDFLLEPEPQDTPNLGKAYSFFTPGARKPPGATQKNEHPTLSSLAPPAATQRIEISKTPPPGTKRSLEDAADVQTNGEPQSPSAPKRARKLKAVEDAMPLAERMRPTSLDDVYGQELVGPGGVLRGMVDEGRLPSMVLWGRPGTGIAPSILFTLKGDTNYFFRQNHHCQTNRQHIGLALRRD
jgi:putative ATPase